MRVDLPYPDCSVDVPDARLMGVYAMPTVPPNGTEPVMIRQALANPIGAPPLVTLARGAHAVLIVCDDVSRPTPAYKIIPHVLEELHAARVPDERIAFIMALGTHRPMTAAEIRAKVGDEVFERYPVFNHAWDDPAALEYMGDTPDGAPVWINRRVAQADVVIGMGRIMPIDVCGFTGGGKILVPGLCGEVTNSEMHWVRAATNAASVVGTRDNPVRAAIDSLARQAGLSFIVNVIMDGTGRIRGCVAGDLAAAHRVGVRQARAFHEVAFPERPDIVLTDGAPFDIEWWQANKALDTAGLVVRPGGQVIVVSPCYEGLSQTHAEELLRYGYPSREEIIALVEDGKLPHKVVGVHMLQVREVMDRAKVTLVTDGVPSEDVERTGLRWAATPQVALDRALAESGPDARVAVLRGASEMLPVLPD